MDSEAKSPSRDLSKTPVTEVPVSHQDDLHLTSTQQSAAATSAPSYHLLPQLHLQPSSHRPHLRYVYRSPTWPNCVTVCASASVGRKTAGWWWGETTPWRSATGGKLLSSTETEGPVTGACELMGRFYWLIDKWSSGRRISVRDGRHLEEISSWTLPDTIYNFTNLAVLGQLLIVPDPEDSQLLVYSSEGQLLSQHGVSGEPTHVSTSGTDVIVSDWRNNTVSVHDTSSSAYRLKFSYTGLEYPTAATVGSDGYLYVGSLSGDNKLHVLSAAGLLITELHHEGLSDCYDLNITGDQLLTVTWGGLYQYQLGW